MQEDKAKKIINEIRDICIKNNIWFEEKFENRPKLGMIEIKINVKIDPVDRTY